MVVAEEVDLVVEEGVVLEEDVGVEEDGVVELQRVRHQMQSHLTLNLMPTGTR